MASTFGLLAKIRAGSRLFGMDILKMLRDLRAERQRVSEAIIVLERLALGGKKRRGRPPKWLQQQQPK